MLAVTDRNRKGIAMKMNWMQTIGQIAVPAFMLIGLLMLILPSGVEESHWRIVGAILAGSALISGTQQKR